MMFPSHPQQCRSLCLFESSHFCVGKLLAKEAVFHPHLKEHCEPKPPVTISQVPQGLRFLTLRAKGGSKA